MRAWILEALNDPTRAWAVLFCGVLLICRECTAPGRIFPGVAGAVAVAVSLYSLYLKPLSPLAVVAIAAAIGLLLGQAFIRAFWLPLAAAAVLLTLGIHFLTTPRIGVLAALAAVPLSGITGFLLRTAVLSRRSKVSIE
jgi:membrane-bound ClpP family serine protease